MLDLIVTAIAFVIVAIMYLVEMLFGKSYEKRGAFESKSIKKPIRLKRRKKFGRYEEFSGDKTGGSIGANVDDLKIQNKVRRAANLYGEKQVIEHFESHFDINNKDKKEIKKKYNEYLTGLVEFIIENYEVDDLEDFIAVSGFSQFAFLPRDKAALVADAYRYTEVTKEDRKKIEKIFMDYADSDVNIKKESLKILLKHRFYRIKENQLKKSAKQLKDLAKKSPSKVFEIDPDPYRPIIRKHVEEPQIKNVSKSILSELRKSNPKLYPLSEINRVMTLQDLVSYLRRKVLYSDLELRDMKKYSDLIDKLRAKIKELEQEVARAKSTASTEIYKKSEYEQNLAAALNAADKANDKVSELKNDIVVLNEQIYECAKENEELDEKYRECMNRLENIETSEEISMEDFGEEIGEEEIGEEEIGEETESLEIEQINLDD